MRNIRRHFYSKKIALWLVLLFVCASTLTANHIHEEEHHSNVDHKIEYCEAYHLADHQQSANPGIFDFFRAPESSCHFRVAETLFSPEFTSPPARAPPAFS